MHAHLIPALFPSMARLGVLRFALRFTDAGRRFDGLGPKRAAEFRAFFANSSHQSAGHAEMAVWEQTAAQARATRRLGEMPLVVVSAAETEPLSPEGRVRLELHEELASLSSRGSHRILAGTTHGSLATSHTHAAQVAEVVRQLVELARSRGEEELRSGVRH